MCFLRSFLVTLLYEYLAEIAIHVLQYSSWRHRLIIILSTVGARNSWLYKEAKSVGIHLPLLFVQEALVLYLAAHTSLLVVKHLNFAKLSYQDFHFLDNWR